MKKILLITFYLLGIVDVSMASTRGDVKIIEATENIQYWSQKITVDYFFFYHREKNKISKEKLDRDIKRLESYIFETVNTATNEKTKGLLNYFIYRINQIRMLVQQPFNEENARKLLEHTEGLLEGSESILKEHKYKFSKEEKMLMLSKKAQYLLEKIITYYMAEEIGLNSAYQQGKMKRAINEMEVVVSLINKYNYSLLLKKKVEKISQIWTLNKDFFTIDNKVSIPYLLLASTEYTKSLLTEIERYHKKNL